MTIADQSEGQAHTLRYVNLDWRSTTGLGAGKSTKSLLSRIDQLPRAGKQTAAGR